MCTAASAPNLAVRRILHYAGKPLPKQTAKVGTWKREGMPIFGSEHCSAAGVNHWASL